MRYKKYVHNVPLFLVFSFTNHIFLHINYMYFDPILFYYISMHSLFLLKLIVYLKKGRIWRDHFEIFSFYPFSLKVNYKINFNDKLKNKIFYVYYKFLFLKNLFFI